MKEDFRERLCLYKEGKLSSDEAALIEKALDKYTAIREFFDEDDEELLGNLKEELDKKAPVNNSSIKKINRKVVKKIISLSLVTILACLIFIPMLTLSAASLLGKAFRVSPDRFHREENFTAAFVNMAFPNVTAGGGSDHTEFYKQQFTCNYTNGISNKRQKGKIEVNYSFGKLMEPKNLPDSPLKTFPKDMFYAVNAETYFNNNEWNYLEKAPEGTKAQIFVTFKSKLSPQQAIAVLGKEYVDPQNKITIDMLAYTGSEIVVKNMNPMSYYEHNNDSFSKQSELDFLNKFNAYEDAAQKEVLLYGLKEIKEHKNIVDYILSNYGVQGSGIFDDIDNAIEYVDKNGVQYVGALITGDTKELLKLKDNPNIYGCSVEDIVVW